MKSLLSSQLQSLLNSLLNSLSNSLLSSLLSIDLSVGLSVELSHELSVELSLEFSADFSAKIYTVWILRRIYRRIKKLSAARISPWIQCTLRLYFLGNDFSGVKIKSKNSFSGVIFSGSYSGHGEIIYAEFPQNVHQKWLR